MIDGHDPAGAPAPTISRRRFVGGLAGGLAVGGVWLSGCSDDGSESAATSTSTTTTQPPVLLEPIDHGPPIGDDPFELGVASGEPDHTSVLLWVWLADAPRSATVEVALDADFARIVHRSEVAATPDAGGTGRVVVDGLNPDTRYHYRFVCDGHIRAGRTLTAPSPGTMPAQPLVVGHLSCMRKSSGHWTALADMADRAPDVVVHCGDYVYEAEVGRVRPESVTPPTDLEGYRQLWRRYKVEPELQAAHAVAPWLVVWDDHEVENNYQGTDPGDPPDGEAFLAQRAAAYRAWWEYTPTRIDPPHNGAVNVAIHRVVDWGALTRFVLLDTRQYRDDQPCESTLSTDVGPRCDATETVTMLGADQEAWFDDVALGHAAAWTTVVQQTVLHEWRLLSGNVLWNLDQWDGYTGARDRLLATLSEAANPVVLSGDVHSSWVAELRRDFGDDGSDRVGVEFVGPGVSSDMPSALRGVERLINRRSYVTWSETTKRGWVQHTIDPDEWRTTYRLVDDVTVPGAPVTEAGSFRVETGARSVVSIT